MKRVVIKEEEGERLDKYLSKNYPSFSRVYLQKAIEEGKVLVNDKVAKSSYKVVMDDVIEVEELEVEETQENTEE